MTKNQVDNERKASEIGDTRNIVKKKYKIKRKNQKMKKNKITKIILKNAFESQTGIINQRKITQKIW